MISLTKEASITYYVIKAFILACEWDSLKDETIIYAERLKNAGMT